VLCQELQHRDEFPALEARELKRRAISRRVWHRLVGERRYPSDMLWIKRQQPAILHSHFGHNAVENIDLAHATGAPWFVSFYGADAYQLSRLDEWQQLYATVFSSAARVLALGPVMAKKLREIGCPEHKVVVHALGVDLDDLPLQPRRRQPNEPLKLLFAGSFREKKGIRYIIEALALARQRGVTMEFHLVGDAWPKSGDAEVKQEIFARIDELHLRDIVTHHPFLKFKELVDLALATHVFVAPSVTSEDGDSEGTPFVLQQMMATGMPCIATLHSDIPFLFGTHADQLIPERDAPAIADRLMSYWERPELLHEHGAALSDQIRTHLDVRACASRLSDLYDEALRGTHR
jgi:colanic acid/amylovoran biosynthesis glycosyltransferase